MLTVPVDAVALQLLCWGLAAERKMTVLPTVSAEVETLAAASDSVALLQLHQAGFP